MTVWQFISAVGFGFACLGFITLCLRVFAFFKELEQTGHKLIECHGEAMRVLELILGSLNARRGE